MLTPIALIQATIDGMMARRFGRIVNITSSSVKNPYYPVGLSTGARAGLTGFVAGLARQTARHNVAINNLLPGSHATDRAIQVAESEARATGKTSDEVMEEHKAARNAGRFGTPRSSARPAPFFAASMPATSSARICSSTGAPIPASSRHRMRFWGSAAGTRWVIFLREPRDMSF